MKLSRNEKADVRKAVGDHNQQVGMNRCLEYWHQHNPAAASSTALIKMLLKLKRPNIAEEVSEYFKSKRQEML